MLTFAERRKLSKQFPNDVQRIQACLSAAGIQVTDDDAILAWWGYSDCLCAGWLMLPQDDADLLNILRKYLPPPTLSWRVKLQDTGNGSEDQTLRIPAEVFSLMRWKEGDTLIVTRSGDEELILRRAD